MRACCDQRSKGMQQHEKTNTQRRCQHASQHHYHEWLNNHDTTPLTTPLVRLAHQRPAALADRTAIAGITTRFSPTTFSLANNSERRISKMPRGQSVVSQLQTQI
jgi:hypothetical protein